MSSQYRLTHEGAEARAERMSPRELVVACCAAQALAEDLGLDRLAALARGDRAQERRAHDQQAYWRSLAHWWHEMISARYERPGAASDGR